jgi:hypothetical protein
MEGEPLVLWNGARIRKSHLVASFDKNEASSRDGSCSPPIPVPTTFAPTTALPTSIVRLIRDMVTSWHCNLLVLCPRHDITLNVPFLSGDSFEQQPARYSFPPFRRYRDDGEPPFSQRFC